MWDNIVCVCKVKKQKAVNWATVRALVKYR